MECWECYARSLLYSDTPILRSSVCVVFPFLFPHPRADVDQAFHHIIKIAVPFSCSEGIVQGLVKRIKLFVDGVSFRVRGEGSRLQPGHRLLGVREGVMPSCLPAGQDGSRDGCAKGAGLGGTGDLQGAAY